MSNNETSTLEISNMDGVTDFSRLKSSYNKDKLVDYIKHLRNKVDELQSYRLIAKRVELLERSQASYMQYNRRESIEIAGIPENVEDGDLENAVCNILHGIGVNRIDP